MWFYEIIVIKWNFIVLKVNIMIYVGLKLNKQNKKNNRIKEK